MLFASMFCYQIHVLIQCLVNIYGSLLEIQIIIKSDNWFYSLAMYCYGHKCIQVDPKPHEEKGSHPGEIKQGIVKPSIL